MTLYLVRHGETDWNREKRFQSRSDIELNETGIGQAQRLGAFIEKRGVCFAFALCSPLSRARTTAQIVLGGSSTLLETEERLIELSVGDFEGRHESDLREELGAKFQSWRDLHFTESAPNGETVQDAMLRLGPVVSRLRSAEQNLHALIVAHQGINMAMMATLSGRTDLLSLADFKQRNDQVEVWDVIRGQRIERLTV